MADLIPLKRALISVSDKHGLIPFAQALADRGVDIISTGGTANALREAKIASRDVSDLTGFPEMMDGRVKTLHPKVHGGLLALRGNIEHQMAMDTHKILPIDLLVVNLYPFEATVAGGADDETAVENIDIGGPAMIRAAAKNHAYVAVVTDVEDYDALLAEMDENDGHTRFAFRRAQALTAYGRTSAYDAAISAWMAEALDTPSPRRRTFGGTLAQPLRYGENPHQRAAFYSDGTSSPSVAMAEQHQGKELSYNNINDTDAAFALASEFDPEEGCACVIVKHANPCGVAVAETMEAAYQKAYDCDRTSAFGGIVAFNRQLDRETAEKIAEIFTEVVIAPGLLPGVEDVLSEKKNLRLLTTDGMADPRASGLSIRQVGGGWLVQDRDTAGMTMDDLEIVSKRVPVLEEYRDMLFAWKVAKHVKSNAIVFAKGEATVGIGAGQMSRVDSTRIAARKARDMSETLRMGEVPTKGASVASDAFFPFPDGIEALAEAGARAVIQPGGSVRDDDVIAKADELNLAMVFTRQRHFRH